MTGPDDEMTDALTRTLRHHAGDAPAVDGIATQAVATVSRRRKRRINASIAAVVVLAVGIPVAIVAAVGGGDTPPVASDAHPTWRWESYHDVQVQVPPDWTYGVPGTAWCIGGGTKNVRPGAVGRPGDIPTIGCVSEFPPVRQRENWLTFDSVRQAGVRRIGDGWVEETRLVNGTAITVLTNDNALRAAILESARPIDGIDRYGCPTDHPTVADPDGYRPAEGGLPQADAVESISVCRYTLEPESGASLLSSSRLAGGAAKDAVAAILAAPEGEGPGADAVGDGSEIVVLRVATADGDREVVIRYSGGSGNGFDDGVTKHALTADAVRPLLTGVNAPQSFSMAVADLLPHR